MSRKDDIGDGDSCPLFPTHGRMFVIRDSEPPKQYCSHVAHDGVKGENAIPRSRSITSGIGASAGCEPAE